MNFAAVRVRKVYVLQNLSVLCSLYKTASKLISYLNLPRAIVY